MPISALYFCLRGALDVSHESESDGVFDSVLLVALEKGSFFGEQSLLGIDYGTGATATVRATIHCELEMLQFDRLREMMETETELTKALKAQARAAYARNRGRPRETRRKSAGCLPGTRSTSIKEKSPVTPKRQFQPMSNRRLSSEQNKLLDEVKSSSYKNSPSGTPRGTAARKITPVDT